jgi:hypothetical protein
MNARQISSHRGLVGAVVLGEQARSTCGTPESSKMATSHSLTFAANALRRCTAGPYKCSACSAVDSLVQPTVGIPFVVIFVAFATVALTIPASRRRAGTASTIPGSAGSVHKHQDGCEQMLVDGGMNSRTVRAACLAPAFRRRPACEREQPGAAPPQVPWRLCRDHLHQVAVTGTVAAAR